VLEGRGRAERSGMRLREGGWGASVDELCVVVYSISQERVVVPLQMGSGKIH
jgi:hypothetical protein